MTYNPSNASKNLSWTKLHTPTEFEPCAPYRFREEARTNKQTNKQTHKQRIAYYHTDSQVIMLFVFRHFFLIEIVIPDHVIWDQPLGRYPIHVTRFAVKRLPATISIGVE